MKPWRPILVSALLIAVCFPPVLAHDFWIELSSYDPPDGAVVSVALRVGEQFQGDPVLRDRSRFESFTALGPAGRVDLPGVEGDDPAGFIRPTEPGSYVIGYLSRPSRIELDADHFESYLEEEGLETIIDERAARGESLAPGREVYSRCAKAILQVGEGAFSTGHVLGFPLEIVPVPVSVGPQASFRILHRGSPLGGVLVEAIRRGDADSPLSERSDHEGLVTFDMSHGGLWLIKTVHMVEADPHGGGDWESLWASLTVERRQEAR